MRPLSVPWTLVTVVLEPTRCFSGPRADVLLTALARLSLNRMERSKQIKKDFIWQRLSECPLGDMQLRRVRLRRNSIKRYVIP